jgi:hypothetical protein
LKRETIIKKTKPTLTDEQKESVLAAHSAVNALAAELESNQPGPMGLLAYVQKLKEAVAPLALLLDEPAPSEGELS